MLTSFALIVVLFFIVARVNKLINSVLIFGIWKSESAGDITNCQTFMNEALKYNKIISETGEFGGSQTTVQEDIIAIFFKHATIV